MRTKFDILLCSFLYAAVLTTPPPLLRLLLSVPRCSVPSPPPSLFRMKPSFPSGSQSVSRRGEAPRAPPTHYTRTSSSWSALITRAVCYPASYLEKGTQGGDPRRPAGGDQG